MRQPTNQSVTCILRRAGFATAFAVLLLACAAPAQAKPPESSAWEAGEAVSGLGYLMIFFGIPLLLIAAIALFTYLPSMKSGNSTALVPVTRQAEWFGGPRTGAAAAEQADATPHDQTGGAGVRW